METITHSDGKVDVSPHCGAYRWAEWPNMRPGYYQDIKGQCGHPRLRVLPQPEPVQIHLNSGGCCRFFTRGGTAPQRPERRLQ